MTIRFEYDPEADAAYLELVQDKIVESEEKMTGIVYDYGKNDQVVGIEILNVKSRTPEQFKQLNIPFSDTHKVILKELFVGILA